MVRTKMIMFKCKKCKRKTPHSVFRVGWHKVTMCIMCDKVKKKEVNKKWCKEKPIDPRKSI